MHRNIFGSCRSCDPRGSHIRDSLDLKRVMIVVVVALLPALLFGMYNTGLQHFRAMGVADASVWTCFWFGFLKVLPIIIVSYVVGLGIEFISAQIRGHEVNEGFLVSGMLIRWSCRSTFRCGWWPLRRHLR